MSVRILRSLAAGSLSILLCACPKQSRISVDPASSADALVFRLGRGNSGASPISFAILRVDRCRTMLATPGVFPPPDSAAWVLEAVIGDAPMVSKVIYGQSPAGYVSRGLADPLDRPGCYVATVSGTGVVAFEINARGQVTVLPEAERRRRGLP